MRREEAEEVIKRGAKCIVCDEHRFAYLVVQKAASTSIKTALLPLFDGLAGVGPEELAREDGTSGVHPLFARSPYQTNKRRFLRELEKGRYEGYFVFAFVRNPWDRLVSCWKQKLAPGDDSRGMGRYEYGGVELHKGMPFAEFVEAVHEIPDGEANPHFRSQHVAVCQDGAVLADFVGRFETLEGDFARVADRIGVGEVRLPHLTRSSAGGRQPYRRFYDERLRRLAEERFGEDAEIFGYSF